jgi:hypothetical protein
MAEGHALSNANARMPRRPKHLTKTQRSKITSILGLGLPRSMAGDYARCHVATIRAEMRRDPEFANQVIQAELRSESSFLKVIHKAGKDAKQWRAAAWALERLYPERYARRNENTLTEEQVHQLIAEIVEMVASELPTKYRQRVFARVADLQTNYRSHLGAKNHASSSTKAKRKPTTQTGGKLPRPREATIGGSSEPDRSGGA